MKNPLTLISGPCAVEELDTCISIAKELKALSQKLNFHYIFKASYKKANRTSLDSFSSIGEDKALSILAEVRKQVGVETLTDVHESKDPPKVSQFVDHLQIPAFLCRQTDLLLAAGESGCGINIKKGQFLSPEAMKFPLEKIHSTGNTKVWLCERGTTFGYQELIVDATSVNRMKALGAPVIMDCTHATQKPNRSAGTTGGDPEMIETLAFSAIATGADGLFIEAHPKPEIARSDSATMLKLEHMEPLLEKVSKLYQTVLNWK